eukprot:gene8234-9081_t
MLIFLSFLALLSFVAKQAVAVAVGEVEASEILSRPLFAEDDFQCKPSAKPLNRFHFRGTSLGGWLVLEPWITPSLFYQFLGATEKWGEQAKDHVALDCYTFCTALGKEEANRQLRQHWSSWVTEGEIANLAAMGVETLRIPVADWMFQPYEPFVGCWDGAIDELNRGLALIQKYNLTAIIDLHALRGSQNGLDNSGDTGYYEWLDGNASSSSSSELRYRHWEIRGGKWAGNYNPANKNFSSVNVTNIAQSLSVVYRIVDLYKDHPAVVGFQPVNEPLDSTPLGLLQAYYWRTYQLVQLLAPHWITLLHDSFRLTLDVWGHHGVLPAATAGKKGIRGSKPAENSDASKSTGYNDIIAEDLSAVSPLSFTPAKAFMRYCDNYAVDTHRYQAWANEAPMQHFVNAACLDGDYLAALEARGIPIIVGEWSLATDNCILWLNGLNDNVPGYPKVKCNRVQCPMPYMGAGVQPNAPPDPSKPRQDPFGTGGPSYVEYGTCPVDRVLPTDHHEVPRFAYAQLHAFDQQTHGFFFWNFRTELPSDRWNYQLAVQKGYLPYNWKDRATIRRIRSGCDSYYANEGDDHLFRDEQPLPDDDGLGLRSMGPDPRYAPYFHMVITGLALALLVGSAYIVYTFYWQGNEVDGCAESCSFASLNQQHRYTTIADRDDNL